MAGRGKIRPSHLPSGAMGKSGSGGRMNAPRPPKSGSARLLISILLLGMGFAAGFFSYNLIVPGNIFTESNSCSAQVETATLEAQQQCQQQLAQARETLPPGASSDAQMMAASSQPATGEGIIEFRFYSADGQQLTQRWVATGAPVPAPAAVETEDSAPDVDINEAAAPKPEAQAAPAQAKQPKAEQPKTKPKPKPAPKPKAKATATEAIAKALDNKPASQKAEKPQAQGEFTVQVSAHKDRSSAESRVNLLERAGVDARVEKAQIPGKGIWYRVRIGKNLTRAQAEKTARKVSLVMGAQPSIIKQ